MKTLASSASNTFLDKYRDGGGSFSSKDLSLSRPPQINFLPSTKLVDFRFLQSISLQHKPIQPVSSLSSDAQEQLESEAPNQETYQTKTVHVRFQLEKECKFGEQFLIVGDDPIFGLWDPTSAIPLNWSDGHFWTVDLDIPVGKSIQFKFILKESTGNILWQPGPDRIFQSWETEKTIAVFEDWENAEYQKISEEDLFANEDEGQNVNSGVLVADNLTQPHEEIFSDVNSKPVTADGNIDSAKMAENHPIAIVADNISYPKEDHEANASDEMLGGDPVGKNTMIAEDILGGNGRAAAVNNMTSTDVEENLITHEGGAVLVPGLTMPTEEEIQVENIAIDASVGINEAKKHDLPELDEKQEPESYPTNEEEQEHDGELKQTPHLAREPQPDALPPASNLLQNDIQWGRRTLQMILNSLKLQ